jgi:hypothetical protein
MKNPRSRLVLVSLAPPARASPCHLSAPTRYSKTSGMYGGRCFILDGGFDVIFARKAPKSDSCYIKKIHSCGKGVPIEFSSIGYRTT